MATKSTLTKTLDDLAIATDLLLSAKSGVRTYAVALTETATPEVRKVLKKQLDETIELHEKIARYMIDNKMYHAYDIEEQVNHDLEKADKALGLAKG
ncbi:spore coat protein [Priestia aryabhattai]|uniref:spore coat protein n=1 Tax=Priestia aryabhattai TaxID=412384 RepID=UPI0007ABFD38|nr:spore coat protein [Priestia aryabhattai]KZE15657.1 spore gernimation protein GerQ [Priestia aryabhattai]